MNNTFDYPAPVLFSSVYGPFLITLQHGKCIRAPTAEPRGGGGGGVSSLYNFHSNACFSRGRGSNQLGPGSHDLKLASWSLSKSY